MSIFDGIAGCAPRSGRSGTLTVTLENDGYGTPDEEPENLVIVEVDGADEKDVEWFKNEWGMCGRWLLDKEYRDARRLILVGRMWWARVATMDGDESDGGFEIEEVKELVR